jgi:hypothetical protein
VRRVGDFGLARSRALPTTDADANAAESLLGADLTAHGAVAGTPSYMSPEHYRGEPVGPAADQFAYCVALYRGLHGQHPFAGDSIAELREQILGGSVREPAHDDDRPADLDGVIRRGLGVRPGDRWPSLQVLLDALMQIQQRDPELDFERSARARRIAMALAIPILGASSLLAGGATENAGLTVAELVVHGGLGTVALALIFLALRKRLLRSVMDRRLAAMLVGSSAAFTFHRAACAVLGAPVVSVFVGDACLLAFGCLLGSLALQRWLWKGAALAVAYVAIAVAFPVVAAHGFNVLMTGILLLAIHHWGRPQLDATLVR